jgi:uncharacterized protein YecE (DUF72 family)
VAEWLRAVPAGFVFHFKAFGLFPARSIVRGSLPRSVREAEGFSTGGGGEQQRVSLDQLRPASVDALWDAFHGAVLPAHEAGKLGLILFQFHLSFRPTAANRAHVAWCRRRLDPRLTLAAEFRCRAWGADGEALDWMRRHGVVLVATDEVAAETLPAGQLPPPPRGSAAAGGAAAPPPPAVPAISAAATAAAPTAAPPRDLMPMLFEATAPAAGFYVRLHRRSGSTQRLLAPLELEQWARRLEELVAQHHQQDSTMGPLYFLIGADWEDAPLRNARALQAVLRDRWQRRRDRGAVQHPHIALDWAAKVKAAAGGGVLGKMFGSAAAARRPAVAVAAAMPPSRPLSPVATGTGGSSAEGALPLAPAPAASAGVKAAAVAVTAVAAVSAAAPVLALAASPAALASAAWTCARCTFINDTPAGMRECTMCQAAKGTGSRPQQFFSPPANPKAKARPASQDDDAKQQHQKRQRLPADKVQAKAKSTMHAYFSSTAGQGQGQGQGQGPSESDESAFL